MGPLYVACVLPLTVFRTTRPSRSLIWWSICREKNMEREVKYNKLMQDIAVTQHAGEMKHALQVT